MGPGAASRVGAVGASQFMGKHMIELRHHVDLRVDSESRLGDPAIQRLDQIIAILRSITLGVSKMSVQLETLAERVAAVESVGDSAVMLLGELKTALDAALASDDIEEAVQALSDRLGAQTQELADAVAANTLAAP